MRKIEINSFPIGEGIIDLARIMDISYFHHGKEYKVEIPPLWGKGIISAVQFESGFGLLMYDCVFHEEVEIHFSGGVVHPLKFMYSQEGYFKVRSENNESFSMMEKYHSAILSSQGENGHIFRFPSGEPIKIRNIEIDRKLFHTRFNCHNPDCESRYQDIFIDYKDDDAFFHDGMYSVTLSDLFKKIDGFPNDGITRSIFLEGIALEILGEQLSLYEDDINGNGAHGDLRKYELLCIESATRIIADELEDICTVPELAYRVGINVNKLQQGFKIVYDKTVNQYIHSTRLKKATELLRYSNCNISEIVIKLGLSSKSYFSKIFKEAYGITPTSYRKMKTKQSA